MAHKACKGTFFKESFLISKEKETATVASVSNNTDENTTIEDTTSIHSICKSSRKLTQYKSFLDDRNCIICNEIKYEKGRKVPLLIINYQSIINQLLISCNEILYFRQGTTSSRNGITYHNVTSLSSQLGEKICAILPAFHSLTGSDFTKPFFGRSKINSFKKLLSKPESIDLMSSVNADHVDIEKVTHFVLHVI